MHLPVLRPFIPIPPPMAQASSVLLWSHGCRIISAGDGSWGGLVAKQVGSVIGFSYEAADAFTCPTPIHPDTFSNAPGLFYTALGLWLPDHIGRG